MELLLPFKLCIILLSAIIFLTSANEDNDIEKIFYQSRGKRFTNIGPLIRLKMRNYRKPSSLKVPNGYGNIVEEPKIISPFDVSNCIWILEETWMIIFPTNWYNNLKPTMYMCF